MLPAGALSTQADPSPLRQWMAVGLGGYEGAVRDPVPGLGNSSVDTGIG